MGEKGLVGEAAPSAFESEIPAVSKNQSPERQPGELIPNRETAVCIREEAAYANDIIAQKYFVDRRMPSEVSIFRVPNFLKDLKKEAYVPKAVSLGPYHSNRQNLSGMDDHKKRALLRMMTRFNIKHSSNRHDTESYNSVIGKIIQDHGEEIWNSYEEKFVDRSCDLALDGCFLLEILRTLGGDELKWEGSNYYEPIFERRKIQLTGFDMLNDILMLENQIPWMVLQKLLELDGSADTALVDVLVTMFYPFNYVYDRKEWSRQPQHLLGVLHSSIVGGGRIQIDIKERTNSGYNKGSKNPPAVELSNAGIKFQPCNGGIMQICFDCREATMYLPLINVTDYTEVLFRNLVALELCQPSAYNYVTGYLSLMNNLINTDEDVGLLRNSGIIKNYLGSDAEVAKLFHGLGKGVPRENSFEHVHSHVTAYYESKFRVLFAKFKKTYFSAWTIPVIVGLLLTLVQTIYATK